MRGSSISPLPLLLLLDELFTHAKELSNLKIIQSFQLNRITAENRQDSNKFRMSGRTDKIFTKLLLPFRTENKLELFYLSQVNTATLLKTMGRV